MTQAKKLIEVAMPIKEISAESVRDKSIRHGHISTLHLWWARRPLPVCRAVVFASLVPDPLDPNCPQSFIDAIEILLGSKQKPLDTEGDPYKTYADIPWTTVIDPMEDNPRNRLQMFIGKFSPKMEDHMLRHGKKPGAKDQLSDSSLIKWDNKNDEKIIGKARKLIWVAHNASSGLPAETLISEFEKSYKAIKDAESSLYELDNRHLLNEEVKYKEQDLQNAIESFQERMPKVFDPFAGGGAIPLEAARLGCKSYGNDINPVAHIIQKGSLEFPQKYGKPIKFSNDQFIKIYGEDTLNTIPNEWKVYQNGEAIGISIPNRLSFDVKVNAEKLLAETEKEIGDLYPADDNGTKPIAYYWARVGNCSNPSCKAEVPLLKGFYLANTKAKQVYLNPIINETNIDFEIKQGKCTIDGWMSRGNMSCPVCGNTTDVKTLKKQFISGVAKQKILAVIINGKNGKEYRLPTNSEISILRSVPSDVVRPNERMPTEYTQALPSCTWGLETWGQMFSDRQLLTMTILVDKLNELKRTIQGASSGYNVALITNLAIWVDRVAARMTMFGLWHPGRETLEYPFGRQAIPMVFDYPESMPFEKGSGSPLNQLDWVIRYIDSESVNPFTVSLLNSSSGDKYQFNQKFLDAVITDPPYYDAIAYADISDFFYVWLKRTLSDIFPVNFGTPQTPKSEECTALKHHHNGSISDAKKHFELKLTQIFDAIEYQTSGVVSIMFAHQSTDAWTTLCNSILGAKMNITGSWALDSEYSDSGLKAQKAFLSSSVTVSCLPIKSQGYGEYRAVKKAIEQKVSKEVEDLYCLGFRGADLLTACFGKAVSEFGKYVKVEKADGSEVTVAELLEMARESAFNALLKGFDGDDFTKFYIGWLQLYNFTESDFDDAAKFSRVGLSIDVQELFSSHILIKNGNKQSLGSFKDRISESKNLGDKVTSHLIDKVHRAMYLYQGTNRGKLLSHLNRFASNPDSSFWRVLTSLCEILPSGSDDHKQAIGLITNKESLIRESALAQKQNESQINLFD